MRDRMFAFASGHGVRSVSGGVATDADADADAVTGGSVADADDFAGAIAMMAEKVDYPAC